MLLHYSYPIHIYQHPSQVSSVFIKLKTISVIHSLRHITRFCLLHFTVIMTELADRLRVVWAAEQAVVHV